jgi:hypothetical protein
MEFNLGFNGVLDLSWLSDKTIVDSSSDNWLDGLRLRIWASHLNMRVWLREGIRIDYDRVRVVDILLLWLNLVSHILHLSTSSLSFCATKFEDNDSKDCSSSNHSNFENMIVSFSFPPSLLLLLFSQIISILFILICLKFFIEGHRSLVLNTLRMFRPLMMFFHVLFLTIWLKFLLRLSLNYHLIQLLLGKRRINCLTFDFLAVD